MQLTGEPSAHESIPLPEHTSSSHHILKQLRDVGLKGRKVDLLYVFTKIHLLHAKLSPLQICR